MANEYVGILSNQGGAVRIDTSGAVNSTIVFPYIPETTLTTYGESLEWSNSADFSSLVTPSDGVVIWEFTTDGVRWQQCYAGNYRPQDNYIIPPKAVGNIIALRIVTSSISGAAYVRAKAQCFFFLDNGIDPRVYNGPYAVTTQSFIESNGKRGLSYEAAFTTNVGAGANADFIMETGQFITLIKSRQVQFTGLGVTVRVYKNPSYTGGSIVPQYNLNDFFQVPTDVIVKAGMTVTAVGTEIAAPTFSLGGSGVGQTLISTFSTPGAERVLAPNTDYLLRVTNNDSSTRTISGYISWFSGRISTQN